MCTFQLDKRAMTCIIHVSASQITQSFARCYEIRRRHHFLVYKLALRNRLIQSVCLLLTTHIYNTIYFHRAEEKQKRLTNQYEGTFQRKFTTRHS